MQCYDRSQAVDRVRSFQPEILYRLASVEEWQLKLEDAANHLESEDAEQVRQAATALRLAASELRTAEGILGDVNVALRTRGVVGRTRTMDIVDSPFRDR